VAPTARTGLIVSKRQLSNPSDLLAFFAMVKKLADQARGFGWDVQITLNTGEVESISMSATRERDAA
jgi:hypothetical protein